MQPSARQIAALKAAVFALALVPLGYLAAGALLFPDWLGANPGELIDRETGRWTLRLLLITLCVTPLRALTGWNWLLRLRRMLGLFAFFYGVMHLSSYVTFRRVFDLDEIARDIAERPFMTVGFVALMLMIPLAVTSTNAMVRRLGAKRWQALHRLVYVIVPLGVLHYWFMVKRDITQPAIYAAVLAVLLGWRIAAKLRGSGRSASGARETANTGLLRPPLVYLAAIVTGALLELAWPLPFLRPWLGAALGTALVAGAVALLYRSAGTFRAAGTPLPGYKHANAIARTGPYRFSRNPMYLAFSLLQLGVAMWLNSLWLVATLIAAAAVIARVVIPREERYLESSFGAEYLDYKASVRRWL